MHENNVPFLIDSYGIPDEGWVAQAGYRSRGYVSRYDKGYSLSSRATQDMLRHVFGKFYETSTKIYSHY